jgi:hypothetical protein
LSITELYADAPIEPVMLELLDEADPKVAAVAAAWLERNGSEQALPELWTALEAWHGRWNGKLRELVGNPITQAHRSNYEQLKGEALVRAIFHGHGWLLSASARSRLFALCIDSRCRESLVPTKDNSLPVSLSIGSAGFRPRYRVGQYAPDSTARLTQKLQQYPRGTTFGWCGDRDHRHDDSATERADRNRWFTEANAIAARLGHRLVRNPPYGTCEMADQE